ncbi:hypothetical protein HF086_005303 [Spodoptera exigua]|uniref:Odorant receptor n=1 Tax=Spodoptera exigua TaxID=7107 RepID=A0A922MZA0_SPOEX|nr:hypothetical protein HF086_005303 [Spodoptera exigua]
MEEEPLLINKTIKKIEIWFRATGTNVKSTPKTRMDTIKSRAIYIINLLWLNMDLSGAVVWFISGIANKKSFTELTYVSPCITLSFFHFKCFFLFLNEDSVDKLLEKLRELEMNERARPKHKDKEAIMIHEYKFLTNLISFLNLFFCGLIVAFALGPVAITIFIYVTTNEVDLQLPFLIIYPFDAFTMKYWPWVYLHQIWSEVVVIVGLGAADYLFYTFCSNISVQFQLLKYNIEHLIPDDETCGRLPNIEEIRTEVVDLIKWHQDLIRSQTPCKLTAWDFSEVNLKSFMKILSTAWSYFALLQTMYGSSP